MRPSNTISKTEVAEQGDSSTSGKETTKNTPYQSGFAHMAKVLCMLGAMNSQLAMAFQVDESTIDDWKRTHEDFGNACKRGIDFADLSVERSLYELAVGYEYKDVKVFRWKGKVIYAPYLVHVPASVEAAIFWLIHRRPNEWSLRKKPGSDADDSEALERLYNWVMSTERA